MSELLDGKEPEADAIHIAAVVESLRACKDPQKRYAADVIERLMSCFSETVKWMPVTERLPEPDTVVLAFSPSTNSLRVNTVRYMGPRGIKDGWITVMDHPVTHWMPLPCEPK